MQKYGIYTLANDVVYDQLVALLNSIEANVSLDLPICIIPYDHRLDKIQQEINRRPQVSLYDNWDAIERWENFAHQVWMNHPKAKEPRAERMMWYGSHLQRKFATFDGVFEKFVFYDADSLAMKPLDDLWDKLDDYDFVFDDWEHKKSEQVLPLRLDLIAKTGLYCDLDICKKLHCSSFFGSKKGLFPPEQLNQLQDRLLNQGEVQWIANKGWWDDAFLFNYLTLRTEASFFNYTLSPDGQDRTGNCANADQFVNLDQVLYNQDGLKPIHRIHYMSYSHRDFTRLSQGYDVKIPHQDVFLYYRFLKKPEQQPKQLKSLRFWHHLADQIQKIVKELQKIVFPKIISRILGLNGFKLTAFPALLK